MPPDRTEYELSVEQELPAAPDGAPRRARLTARWNSQEGSSPPGDAQVTETLRDLTSRLGRAVGTTGLSARAGPDGRPDRSLSELIDTYRPRQPELVELLHADGELTDGEYELLRARGAAPAEPVAPAPAPRATARPVEELLRAYQIESLRQAGAVRARRQISFEEYMALKRHFGGSASEPAGGSPPA